MHCPAAFGRLLFNEAWVDGVEQPAESAAGAVTDSFCTECSPAGMKIHKSAVLC